MLKPIKPQAILPTQGMLLAVCLLGVVGGASAQEVSQPPKIQLLATKEILFEQSASTGLNYRIDASTNLLDWISLTTLRSTGLIQHTDTRAPYLASRFYRALPVSGSTILTGDHLATADGEIIFHPINHASFVMSWNGKLIYNDPVGGSSPYQGLPRADLILVSHSHGDHFDATTLNSVRGTNVVIIAPRPVYNSMTTALKNLTIVLNNGEITNVMGLAVEAIPAYNGNHPKGDGNGYVVTVGGKRLYMSGDTGNIPEMRSLQNIDVAFVCVNVPYTMTVSEAATAVRAFAPRVVYPYHFRNSGGSLSDLNALKQQIGADLGVEVRSRKWY